MNIIAKALALFALSAMAFGVQAETTRDCLLEGTVQKSPNAEEGDVNVKFHSVSKYDEDARCRVRRGEKMEFKLPEDPRLKDADTGSSVKYRYRTESDGSSSAELISIDT